MATSITLSAGQVSQIISVAPGTRITSSGNGSISWVAGSLSDAKNGSGTWATWAKGSAAGYMDTVRQLCIRATATGNMTITLDEGVVDKYPENVYFDTELVSAQTNPDGSTSLVGAGGVAMQAVAGMVLIETAEQKFLTGSGAINTFPYGAAVSEIYDTLNSHSGSGAIVIPSGVTKAQFLVGVDTLSTPGDTLLTVLLYKNGAPYSQVLQQGFLVGGVLAYGVYTNVTQPIPVASGESWTLIATTTVASNFHAMVNGASNHATYFGALFY